MGDGSTGTDLPGDGGADATVVARPIVRDFKPH